MNALRVRQKQQLFILVAELHKAGITTAAAIATVLRISDTYARRILRDLGIPCPPRHRAGILDMLDTKLRTNVEAFSSENRTKT